jgi:uncharacterized protein YndB with AHSA1/START domain
MSSTKTETETLEVRRTIKASAKRLFELWTNPEKISVWFGGGCSSSVKMVQNLKLNGEYSIEAIKEDGLLTVMSGKYIEIVPNEKLVYTWTNTSKEFPAVDTIVSVEFLEKGESTEIVLRHSNFTVEASRERHAMGWGMSLDKLVQLYA